MTQGSRCRTPDQLQRHRAAGPSDQRTDDADTYQWTSRTRAPGVYSRIHVPYAGTTLGGRTWPCWSLLHTAGQDNSGRVIRLHLPGPAILGSGPEQGREEQRGPTRGGTGGRRRLRRAEQCPLDPTKEQNGNGSVHYIMELPKIPGLSFA